MYRMPAENAPHEGTWLIWPHQYSYGKGYRREIENIWIQMTRALHTDELVHIIAYNKKEQTRIMNVLSKNNIEMSQIDFLVAPTDDVWIRDTGPIFVIDNNQKLTIADFKFDGWGHKFKFQKDNQIPAIIGKQKALSVINIPDFVLEGGSIDVDGGATLMACRSSIISENRNAGITIQQVEIILSQYLGVSNFIWLDGVTNEDITDAHIDGIARFFNEHTIVTVSKEDFKYLYEGINLDDYNTLLNATNVHGETYEIINIPLTKKNVKGLDYKGSYLNYYVGNKVVLTPIYRDEHDVVALNIIAKLYSERKIIPIVVTSLFPYGGMLHCVTQQQPFIA